MIFGSGDEAAFERIRPVFEKMSRVVHYLGHFGAGSVMKFVHNLLVAIHNCSAGEAFALGMKAGIDPQVIYDVISTSAGTSRMFEVRGTMMVSGDYDTKYLVDAGNHSQGHRLHFRACAQRRVSDTAFLACRRYS